jgi:hypothetical protein
MMTMTRRRRRRRRRRRSFRPWSCRTKRQGRQHTVMSSKHLHCLLADTLQLHCPYVLTS